MRRRAFMTLLGSAAAAWPLAARAQHPAIPVIGFLGNMAPGKAPQLEAAFRQGLSESGFVEGMNVAIESRWVGDRYDLLPAVLTDLVRQRVALIVVTTDTAALAAKTAAAGVPIVFAIGGDPVEMGLVASMNRPGGNLTGVTGLNAALLPKKLELLHELLPAATNIAALVNPANPNAEALSKAMHAAARTLGLQLHVLRAVNEGDFDRVFATLVELRSEGLLIGGDPFLISRERQLAALALRHAVPTISNYRDFATAGGLMSYGGRRAEDLFRPAGIYAGRILKVFAVSTPETN